MPEVVARCRRGPDPFRPFGCKVWAAAGSLRCSVHEASLSPMPPARLQRGTVAKGRPACPPRCNPSAGVGDTIIARKGWEINSLSALPRGRSSWQWGLWRRVAICPAFLAHPGLRRRRQIASRNTKRVDKVIPPLHVASSRIPSHSVYFPPVAVRHSACAFDSDAVLGYNGRAIESREVLSFERAAGGPTNSQPRP